MLWTGSGGRGGWREPEGRLNWEGRGEVREGASIFSERSAIDYQIPVYNGDRRACHLNRFLTIIPLGRRVDGFRGRGFRWRGGVGRIPYIRMRRVDFVNSQRLKVPHGTWSYI